jgi:predicted kinase
VSGGLVVLGGLPGSGKTTLAREVARRRRATHVRIDSIETALVLGGLARDQVEDLGYRVGYAVAGDVLDLGGIAVADSVNPLPVTRAAWRQVAASRGLPSLDVEVVCSDATEHRRRVEHRSTDLPGLRLPTWAEVRAREYQPWQADVRVDLAVYAIGEAADLVLTAAQWLAQEGGRYA